MENYNTGIYQIVNLINGKRYIGSAVNFEQREISHFNTLIMQIHKNKYLQRAYNKYGKENFKFELILYCDKENLIFYEQRAIDAYDFKKLYNISKTAGSNLGMKFTEEHKRKIGNANRGKKHSEESIRKSSQANKGRTMSTEHKEKLSKLFTGKKRNPEIGIKISIALTGKKLSVEHIKNMSIARKGIPTHTEEHKKKMSELNKGKKLTQEHKNKIGIANSILFSDNQIEEIKELRKQGLSYKNISKKFNCSKSVISKALKTIQEKGL